MPTVETSGKSVAEAKEIALRELGVPDDENVQFEVLEEGGRGVFGKSTQAKIRATLIDLEGDQPGNVMDDHGLSEEHIGEPPTEEVTAKVLQVASKLAELSGFRIEPRHTGNQGRYVLIDFHGRDSLFLTQRHAELMDALQYLINVVVGKTIDHNARVILDAQNYRRRRAENLRNLAVSLAVQVKDRQEEAELDPLPAHERRIIHKTLLSDDGVQTYSEGNEPNRYVVITPVKSD